MGRVVLEDRRRHQPGRVRRNATKCAVQSASNFSDLLFAAATKYRADFFSFEEYKSGHGLD